MRGLPNEEDSVVQVGRPAPGDGALPVPDPWNAVQGTETERAHETHTPSAQRRVSSRPLYATLSVQYRRHGRAQVSTISWPPYESSALPLLFPPRQGKTPSPWTSVPSDTIGIAELQIQDKDGVPPEQQSTLSWIWTSTMPTVSEGTASSRVFAGTYALRSAAASPTRLRT